MAPALADGGGAEKARGFCRWQVEEHILDENLRQLHACLAGAERGWTGGGSRVGRRRSGKLKQNDGGIY